MRRDQREHAISTACQIIGRHDVIVVGSQPILGTFREDQLPADATMSVEIDILPIPGDNSETGSLADLIEGVAWEFSLARPARQSPERQHRGTRRRAPVHRYLDKEDLRVAKLCAFRERIGISSQHSGDPRSSTARPSPPGSPPWTSATAERPRWPVRGSVRCKQVIDLAAT
jgi:hypothetical protein